MATLCDEARAAVRDFAPATGLFLKQWGIGEKCTRTNSLARPAKNTHGYFRVLCRFDAGCGRRCPGRLAKHQDIARNHQKQARARQLLAQNQLPLTAIALACGYSSPSHFSNRFQAVMGIAPSRYRELRRRNARLVPDSYLRPAAAPSIK